MTNQYKFGRNKEKGVAQLLRNKGASVKMSKGSKGAANLKVRFSTGTKWNVQVKSTRSSQAASLIPKDANRLKVSSAKSKATSVVAKVTRNGTEFISARSGRKLSPPKKK